MPIDRDFLQQMCSMTGYEPITTFWDDFSIADAFGKNAVEDTYDRAFREWKSNYKYLTELVMIINWKCWEHHTKLNTELSEWYGAKYYELREWALDNLEGEELDYYLSTTD